MVHSAGNVEEAWVVANDVHQDVANHVHHQADVAEDGDGKVDQCRAFLVDDDAVHVQYSYNGH